MRFTPKQEHTDHAIPFVLRDGPHHRPFVFFVFVVAVVLFVCLFVVVVVVFSFFLIYFLKKQKLIQLEICNTLNSGRLL